VTDPFPMVELAVKELIETNYPAAVNNIGGDMSYDGDPLYVMITLTGGSSDLVDGEWILDIDCFAPTYTDARHHALLLEPILLGPRHVTSTMRLDNCYQNETPTERPWDVEDQFRVGATYVFTARRTG
jgi:hypothetical protein